MVEKLKPATLDAMKEFAESKYNRESGWSVGNYQAAQEATLHWIKYNANQTTEVSELQAERDKCGK